MAAHTISSLNPSQTNVVQSIYNSWQNSPYSNDTSVLYKTIGIATGEGLDRANPMASNPDSGGTSFGPFQLFSGGLGADLARQTGTPFGSQSLDTQSNYVVNYIGAHGTAPWMSVRDTPGGINAVMTAGQNTLANSGVSGVGGNTNLAAGPVDTSSGINAGSGSVGASGSGSSSTSSPPAEGAPIRVALQPEATSAIQGWVNSFETSVGDAFANALKHALAAVGIDFGAMQNWFVRAGVILLGMILVMVGLLGLFWDRGGKQLVQQYTPKFAA